MEEAPKGTFQDELDWCTRQLETGLLRQSPTPQQAQDTKKILRILRSRKATFVKKRQVMNKVFGDYRLKMAEEREQKENSESGSVASNDDQSSSMHWFIPSDNSFSFNFCPEADDEDGSECTESCKASCGRLKGVVLATEEGSDSNSPISAETESSSQNCEGLVSTAETSGDQPSANPSSGDQPSANPSSSAVENVEEAQEASSQNVSGAESSCSTSGLPANQDLALEATEQNLPDAPNKKKKKPRKKRQRAQAESGGEEHTADPENAQGSILPLMSQPGVTELQRELDWCVEQLEKGLRRKKCARRQFEEAVRAIKLLRNNRAPLVMKRQVMHTMFGDYRKKMASEKQQQLRLMQTAAKSARVMEVSEEARRKSSRVFRKSAAHRSTGDNGPDLPRDSGDSAQGDPSQGGFTFQPSQEPFCFNFL